MRGHSAGFGSVDYLTRAIREEFPELDYDRLRAAVERAIARAASASLDTEGYRVVDLHLARVEASEESSERAVILRDLSDNLEQRGDADRALVTRLAAFTEGPTPADIDALLRLARVTQRWSELPLDTMSALIDIQDEAAARRLTALATAWQQVGRAYYAADCLERVLLIAPADPKAHEALELFYRSTNEWPALVELLDRRAVHLESDRERAELYREIGRIYERELGDETGALDAYREADRLFADHPDALDGIARLVVRVGEAEGEALGALERQIRVVTDPKQRAPVLARAAELAKLQDWDKSLKLFQRALADDPDLVAAIDGYVQLLRDRGQLADAVSFLIASADRPALATERARWLTDAADFCVGLGETDRARELYRQVRTIDPGNRKAGIALVELWDGPSSDGGSLQELVPILDELCRTTQDPARLRHYLLQRSKIAAELGDRTGARKALTQVVDIDPHDLESRRELSMMLYDAQQWAKARPLMEGLFEYEDMMPPEACIDLHYKVARCAHELGDNDAATNHATITLALDPTHRAALLLKTELNRSDPVALAADQLALANLAPPEERASRFAALGDRYIELGDRATAREMYREALVYRPGDHLLLTKFLELVADEGDWGYSMDLVQRLIDTEQDPKVRARYRQTAAMIARDELADPERARALLEQAIEDDPMAFGAADELEAMLAGIPGGEALMVFYARRLEHMRALEGRAGERLRLWDRLGELCLTAGRRDDAVAAFEVALTFDADNLDRRIKLADLYLDANPAHDPNAIIQHQAVLRMTKRRLKSYSALRSLYRRTNQPDKARACDDAIAIIGAHKLDDRIDDLFERDRTTESSVMRTTIRPPRALSNDDWLALARIDVDLHLSGLFAVIAPPFAVERARMRPPQVVPPREHDLPQPIARVIDQVANAFGIQRPPTYLDRAENFVCKISMRVRQGVLAPVLFIGRLALDKQINDHELAFLVARQLSDLRNDRIARLLCPRAGELAQIIELASGGQSDSTSHASRWLSSSLHPMELDQAMTIGARLRERGVHPLTAALAWMNATERAADRIGFVVVGDLGTCVRVLEKEPSAGEHNRVLELIWSSITEDVLSVRARVEGWATTPAAAAATATRR
ncbi:MAG: tetratricopeptide repeat protein [Kofleriaceae bacterium]